MKPKLSRKILGKKIRTSMVMHRLVVKFYENGITIKPWKSQGKFDCPQQEALFLTKENIKYLRGFLEAYADAEKITESLNNKEEEIKPLPHIILKPTKI